MSEILAPSRKHPNKLSASIGVIPFPCLRYSKIFLHCESFSFITMCLFLSWMPL